MGMTIAIISGSLTLLSGIILWALHEKSKRDYEIFRWKVELYSNLIDNSNIFLVSERIGLSKAEISKSIQRFMREQRLSWLFGSDEVVLKGAEFLEQLKLFKHRDSLTAEEAAKRGWGGLLLAIRKDVLGKDKTDLQVEDYKIFSQKVV